MTSPADVRAFSVDVFDLPAYGHNHDAWKIGRGAVAVSDVATDEPHGREVEKATLARRIVESLSSTPPHMSARQAWQQMIAAASRAEDPLLDDAQVGAALARISEAGVEFSVFGDAAILVALADGRAHWMHGSDTSAGVRIALRACSEELSLMTYPADQVAGFIIMSGGASRHLEFNASSVWHLLSHGHLPSTFHSVAADMLAPLSGDITVIRVLLPATGS